MNLLDLNTRQVLDKGFVRLMNVCGPTRRTWDHSPGPEGSTNAEPREFDGDDIDPANVARKSFNQMDSGRTRDEDLRLCDYLMRNRHTTPFQFVQIYLTLKLPIFVARQLMRQRTQSIDEVSGRYVQLPDDWYVCALEDIRFAVADKKQGGGLINLDDPIQVAKARVYQHMTEQSCKQSYANYQFFLDMGIAPELARTELHLNYYTEYVVSMDLHNMLNNFFRLRDHSHAQLESQRYAQAADGLVRRVLPNSMALYDKYVRME